MKNYYRKFARPGLMLLRMVTAVAMIIGQVSAVPVTYAQETTEQAANTVFLPFTAANHNQAAAEQQVVTEQPAAPETESTTPVEQQVPEVPAEQVEQISLAAAPVGQGFNLNASDLRFIMKQIRIAERHAATLSPSNPCGTLVGNDPDQIPTGTGQTIELPWGLRTVDGSCNHLAAGQERFGTADRLFPRLLSKEFRAAENNPPIFGPPAPSHYNQTTGNVFDSQPRTVSNLIVDQTVNNTATVQAAGGIGVLEIHPASGSIFIPNTAPDVGLSAPYNSWFTLFGQFFDHGLDLVNKGGNGTVFIPLQADDPLLPAASAAPFMVLTRATQAGDHEATNQTSTWVDQSQTYTSHPSHQVFLRKYTLVSGRPVGTGGLLTGVNGGMATWADVKTQARDVLGIALSDTDALNIPLLATDPYGRFLRGPNGFPQMVKGASLVEGNLITPIDSVGATPTGHAFLDDIAHHAAPGAGRTPDGDSVVSADDNNNATYDDELLNAHFIAGDGRANENIGLTAVHHIFHSEHNRLVLDIQNLINTDPAFTQAERDAWSATTGPAGWDLGERLFQAARFVTEMEYQHLAFEEFIRKVQPMVNPFGGGGTGFHTEIDPAIRAEFAHVVYRFGHSMLTESVDRIRANGTTDHIDLLDAFLNPPAFYAGYATPDEAVGAIVRGMTSQVGNELDEFVTEALRNRLLGLPLDLAALNMARGRDTGVPRLNEARRQFYTASQNSALAPYESWMEFGFAIRNYPSLYNFIAAYGTHPTITGNMAQRREAARRLLDLDSELRYVVDAAWPACAGQFAVVDTSNNSQVGGCYVDLVDASAAQAVLQDPLTAAFVADATDFLNSTGAYGPAGNGRTTTGVDDIDFWVGGLAEKQMVFGGLLGPTFNYVFEKQMEDLQDGDRFYYLARTVGLNLLVQLEGNSFAELIQRNSDAEALPADAFSRPAYVFHVANLGTSGAILDDPSTPYNENALLIRMANGTIRYTGPEHVVFNGTAANDRIWSSEGDDTIRGNDGNDWAQGGDGNDNHIGGLGDDILLDSAGDDTIKGGDGNDAISSGQGFAGDLNQGGRGNDYIVGGNDTTESFGGSGNDFIYAGDGEDEFFGDDGDDWLEAGRGPFNLLQGDNGAPFQNDPNQPGNDVLIGYGGEQDYDSEGGDDIMLMGPGIQRAEGMFGFDWSTHKADPNPADSDMLITGLLPPTVENNRDRFDLTEGLSGWNRNDILRGDNRVAADLVGHELNAAGIARIAGLAAILPPSATSFAAGNILLGGDGSDTFEGRGGDDIIDGDRWLDVQIRVTGTRPAGLAEFHDGMATLNTAIFNGQVNPGQLEIVRTIRPGSGAPSDCGAATPVNCDVAVFSGLITEYTITNNPDGSVTVDHNGGIDGVDTLRNVETLLFANGATPAPAVSLSPTSLTFPNQTVNTSAVQIVVLTNNGTAPLSINSITISGADFTQTNNCPATVAVNGNCTISVTFLPTGIGARTGTLTINNDAAGSPHTVALSGTGIAATAPAITLNPNPLTFASQTVNTTSGVQNVTLTNSGTAPMLITTIVASAEFAQTNNCPISPSTLAVGATCTIGVTFTPTATGARTGSITVNSNAASGVSTVTLTGTGAAVTAPAATLSPNPLTFASQTVNTTSGVQNVTLTNSGTALLNMSSIVVSGEFARSGGTCAATLAAGASCTIGVTFTPTATGARPAGAVTVTDNAAGSPHTVVLNGTGAAAPTTTTVTFSPVADTYVRQDQATTSFGTATTIQSVSGTSTRQSFLRFTVTGLPVGATISSATIRLFVTNGSTSGGIFNTISNNSWSETAGVTTWNTRPAIDGPVVATMGNVPVNTFVNVTLAAGTITGNGTYNFAISHPAGNTDTLQYASQQHGTLANRPQLIIVTGSGGPVTPPAAPTGLTATAGNAQVTLNWTAVAGATSYNIKRATTNGGPYTTVSTGVTTNSFVNTGLTNGTAYFFVVSAVNAGGESGNSNQATATPAAVITPPAAPTGLTATAGNAQVSLAWTAVAGATSYNIKRATTNGGPYATVGTATTNSFVNTGLTNGTAYFFVVTAVNAGGESGNSNQASATPTAPVGGTTITVQAVDDTFVEQADPNDTTNGTRTNLRVLGSTGNVQQSFIRFTVSGLPVGATISSVTLRLFVTNDSTSGGIINKITNNTWTETTTWNTRPTIDGTTVATLGAVAGGVVNVTLPAGTITGNGTYNFAIQHPAGIGNTLDYASSEHGTVGNRPQLIITTN